MVLTVVSFFPAGVLVFTFSAFQFSWLYLRYYRHNNGTYGDLNDTFAYQTLFPSPLRPSIAILSSLGFLIFKPALMAAQKPDQSEPDAASAEQPSKGSTMDTERRRQRALKVLDERLQAATSKSDENTDSAV